MRLHNELKFSDEVVVRGELLELVRELSSYHIGSHGRIGEVARALSGELVVMLIESEVRTHNPVYDDGWLRDELDFISD